MRTGVIVSGLLVLLVNFAAWLLLDVYDGFHASIVAVSILVTLSMQVFVLVGNLADAYRIVLGGLLGATGFVRIVLCVFLPREFGGNTVFFVIVVLLAIELLALTWAHVASRFHKESAPAVGKHAGPTKAGFEND